MGTWRLDLRSGDLAVSAELRRMYGTATEEESEPRAHHDDADDPPRGPAGSSAVAFERALATGEATVVEHRVVHGDGSVGHVRSYIQPVVEGGQVVGAWGTTQDITERVADRDALDAEHGRRITAEAVAEFASTLSGAADRQDVADAVHEAMRPTGDVSFVALGLRRGRRPGAVRQYFAGPGDHRTTSRRGTAASRCPPTPRSHEWSTRTPEVLG